MHFVDVKEREESLFSVMLIMVLVVLWRGGKITDVLDLRGLAKTLILTKRTPD